MKELSKIRSAVAPSATLAVNSKFKQMKAEGIPVVGFGAGEQKEYTGGGWIKFKGEDGSVWGTDTDGSASSAKGSSVQGYYNAKTHEIQFIVNYNMMNVRSECFKQTIDKSRLATFEADKKKYEEDLAAYKKEHGIN